MPRVSQLIFFSLILLASAVQPTKALGETINIKVKGMVCSLCAHGLNKKLSELPVVKAIFIEFEGQTVKLELKEGTKLSDSEIIKLVKASGYEVGKIEREKVSTPEGASL